MSTPARVPAWFPPLSVIAIAFIIWMISFTPRWLSPYALQPFSVTGQALLLGIIIRAFCYWPPMIRWVGSMSVPHRIVFGVLIGSMILGHYTLNSRRYFPYVAWEIFPFVREDDPVTCRDFIATTASGSKVRLLVEQLFPSIVQINALDDPRYFTPETLDHLARALAKVYNEHHANDPVRQVDLYAMAVKLHPPANELRAEPSCEFLQHYDISSGR